MSDNLTSVDSILASQQHIPSLLVVGGTQRGGTTLLMRFICTHPAIDLYVHEQRSLNFYDLATYLHLMAVGKKLIRRMDRMRLYHLWRATITYSSQILKESSIFGFVTIDTIHKAMIGALADENTRYVGDKYPSYLLDYPRFIHRENTKCIFIYRDPRDVMASNLVEVKYGWWKDNKWAEKFNSIEKLCSYWLLAMHCINDIQQLDTNALIIQYEDFVTHPQITANQIAEHLGLDASQFDVGMPNTDSIGKHKQTLTSEEIAVIEDMTGDMMRTFEYL